MDVLIDVRCLQADEHGQGDEHGDALARLRQARAALPSRRLIGLVDQARAVPDEVRSLLDGVRNNAYTGAMDCPTCLVQLAPLAGDPLVLARMLLDSAIPAVTVTAPFPSGRPHPGSLPEDAGVGGGLAEAVARHWAGRYDRIVPAPALWGEAAALAPLRAPSVVTGKRARVAVLTTEADSPLCLGLRDHVELDVVAPNALPLLSPRFDRVVSLIANRPGHAGMVDLVARFGGGAVVEDSCLLAAYAGQDARAIALAQAEIGRSLDPEEMAHWFSGVVRPGALMLGDVAGAAEPLVVHGAALAALVRQRYGVEPVHIPLPVRPAARRRGQSAQLRIQVHATARTEEACIWALDILRSWNVDACLATSGAASPRLAALGRTLGLADRVGFGSGDADLGLFLAVPGEASLTRTLAETACSGMPCVASRGIAEGFDCPDWVRVIPEGPSPLLVAEAVLGSAPPDAEAVAEFQRRHDPSASARLLCEALGLR